MGEHVVDAKGMLCPQPLILTKKALKDLAPGERVTIEVDNATSKDNVERFLKDNGTMVDIRQTGDVFTLEVVKGAERELSHPDAQAYCVTGPARRHAVCFRGNTMGMGDEELGILLAKAFVNTIKDVEPLPEIIVFYNSGIFLALKNSPVIEPLRKLESLGVKILVCGTCLDFYEKKEAVGAGIISNMYDILQALAGAGHVITP